MNQEVKKEWVKALRSGEFKQSEGQLKVPELEYDRYCCLGVLCEIHRRRFGGEWKGQSDIPSYLEADMELPREVIEWAELSSSNPEIKSEGITLAALNDGDATFSDIARYIEDEL